jgi:dihydrolipoamide dehydrogenase
MSYDLVIIGSGPGGYVCAIRAAQLGFKVAVVEKDKTFGGTCLNVGCIPSKAMLHASHLFEDAGHVFAAMGIGVSKPKLDLAQMMKFKDEGVEGNVKGVDYLFKKNKVESFRGKARIVSPGKVEVGAGNGKAQVIEAKAIVIATGSDVAHRRAGIGESARAAARGRCGRNRAGTWLGVAPPRRQGRSGRIPRPHLARDG